MSEQKWTGYCDHSGEACECGMEIISTLRARCDELNEACSAKQALLDHVAADERDFMELVEGYKRERDAEHLSRLSSDEQMRFQIKRAEGLRAEVARQDAEIAALTERFVPLVEENERLRAALLRLCRACDPAYDGWGAEEIEVLNEARAALSHSAATGEGCPDGVENCPGDCTGERPATVPHYDTLEIAQPETHTVLGADGVVRTWAERVADVEKRGK